MRFLTKRNAKAGLAVHIADTTGAPLCGKRLKLETWRLHTYLTETDVICASCRRIYTAQTIHTSESGSTST